MDHDWIIIDSNGRLGRRGIEPLHSPYSPLHSPYSPQDIRTILLKRSSILGLFNKPALTSESINKELDQQDFSNVLRLRPKKET